MIDNSCRFRKWTVGVTLVLAGLVVASCAPQYSSPEQVQASNPSVTYKYRSDQELIQANQNAVTFCNRYQSFPQTVNIANDPDGSRVVVFECVPASQAATTPPQSNPNLTYNYRTDQELLDASRNAQIYCMNSGSQRMTSNIVVNANGTKTVTFQCSSQ